MSYNSCRDMKNNKKKILPITILLAVIAMAAFGVLWADRLSGGGSSVKSGTETAAEGGGSGSSEEASDAESSDIAEKDKPLATLFFASDYQYEPGFAAPADTLRAILSAAKADGKEVDRVVMCGDYSNDSRLHDYQVSPDGAIEEIRGIVSEVCPDVDGEDLMFVQGNHDRMTESITATGLYEEEDYLVYILNTEEDFPWKQGKTAGSLAKVRKSAAEMKECFDGLIARGETRPVFIAVHVPLHFTARTSSRHSTGDNLYSSLIFDVVNEAAKSLDIVYMHGHNHSKGWDCYMGGSSAYKAPGDTILIPRFEEWMITSDEYTEETLRFSYLNAGYSGYYMNCGSKEREAEGLEKYRAADETLTGTVAEVYSDRIVLTRYDSEGVHDLGSTGAADPYKGGIDAGLIGEESCSKETPSPQEIKRRTR